MDDLFDWTPPLMTEPRSHGTDTSIAAAKSMAKCSGPMQMRILRFIVSKGSATYDDVVVGLGMEKPTVAGRLNDLHGAGFIVDSGHRSPTRSGRSARVYVATDDGHRKLKS